MAEVINKDLVKERRKCTFNTEELTHVIDCGEDKTQDRRNIEKLVLSVKELKDEVPEEYMSYKEKYENVIRKSCIMYELFHNLKNTNLHEMEYTPTNKFRVIQGIAPNVDPFLIHFVLFLPNIVSQGTTEQKAEWTKQGFKILGTYAQTELGHGTFVRGLETTATFDVDTDEFIVNSPTITSYKFWPGGLGHTVNTCIVMAQLYIHGKCHGPHLFVVQIRDFDTHEPLPGIKVGDIGPKMGYNTVNNGFLGFTNFRIPRKNMLMKNAQVSRDGTYVRNNTEKLIYGSMLLVRTQILNNVAFHVSVASTIAIRYSAVRHQSQLKRGEPEVQVLDYATQQHKLFISVASSHAYRHVGLWMWENYNIIINEVTKGNLERLSELHALSCCLKAVVSRDGVNIVEECRFACGGHGYLLSSNLPGVRSNLAAIVTYEGEYTILLLQTARYLMKCYNNAVHGKTLPASIAFLEDFCNKRYKMWTSSPEGIIQGFNSVAAGRTKEAYDAIQRHVANGKDFEDAGNLSSVLLSNASEAYARSLLCNVYWNETQKLLSKVSTELGVVLQQLAELYLVYWALEKRGDLLMYSTLSKEDIDKLYLRYEELLGLIRPNAVGLVDAFDIRDEILCSTLGSYDGRVYERLMEAAAKNPLNADTVNQSFHKYVKPFKLRNKM
ncbi:unnamed protein product, partial [Brenthis ino]